MKNEKRFDKEYQTSYPLEFLYLKENGVPYTFVKKDSNGNTVWKYQKTKKLFEALMNFYGHVET